MTLICALKSLTILNLSKMKKTIIAGFIILASAMFNYTFANTSPDPLNPSPEKYTTLIIDANVTVVLVNNPAATLQIVGDDAMNKYIQFEKGPDTLVIKAVKRRNYKEKGIIYVPATNLRKIAINSMSDVSSYRPLQVPRLDILINGDCKLEVSNIGELNVSSTEFYSFEQTTEIRKIPVSLLRSYLN